MGIEVCGLDVEFGRVGVREVCIHASLGCSQQRRRCEEEMGRGGMASLGGGVARESDIMAHNGVGKVFMGLGSW